MDWIAKLKEKAQDRIILGLFALIALLLLIVWRAVPSSVWDRVSEAVPKRALWALLGLEGIAICLLVGALIDNWHKKKQAASVRQVPFILFGVHWDSKNNPRCPVCECLMPIHHREDEIDILWCPRCKTLFSLWNDSGERLSLERAKAGVDFFRS
jgi:hypothetical protein